jgi:two-component system response regulator HydG
VANQPGVPVVVITAFGSMDTAVAAMRAGAYDFVTKPIEMDLLALAVERAIEHRKLSEKVRALSRAVARSQRFDELLGASAPMQALFDELERIADAEASVMIIGESGTGKELIARALHNRSRRAAEPFVTVGCSALPEALLESELFGHTRGAFTDARSARQGLFLHADGGTLFLDEIGDMPLALQPKLLRALEENRIRPIGSDREVPFDARIIAATNRDIESAVDAGQFRKDLYFRLNVIQLNPSPLRARGTDVLLLAKHFLERFADSADKRVTGMTDTVAEKLLAYEWPGNVRELRNAVERAVALTRTEKLTVEDLPQKIRAYSSSQLVVGGYDPTELIRLEELEKRYILHVLHAVNGNKTMAGRVLGIDRKTLYRKLTRYGVSDEDGA